MLALVLFVAVGVLLTGCDSQQASNNDNTNNEPPPPWSDYENQLQRALYDAATTGEARGAENPLVIHEMIQVEIQMDTGSELPTGYLILEEARAPLAGLTIQAYVRVDQLLELSQEESINYIRAPSRPRR